MEENRIKTEEIIKSMGGIFRIEGDKVIDVSTEETIGVFSKDGILDISEGKWSEVKENLYNQLMEANVIVTAKHCRCAP